MATETEDKQITVIGKGDLGFSPFLNCEIKAGEVYTIYESQMSTELFEIPTKKQVAAIAAEGSAN